MEHSDGEAIATRSSPREITSVSQPREDLRWELLKLSPGKLEWLWEKVKAFPQVFDDYSKDDFNDFAGKFLVRSNVFVDIGPGLGLAAGFGVRVGLDAVVHLVMFDRRLRGREWLFKEIMGYFFRVLKLRRMTMIVPAGVKTRTTVRLAERIGFKLEGTMRQAMLIDGKYMDNVVYGILREELTDGPVATAVHAAPNGQPAAEDAGNSAGLVALGESSGEG